ncbi:MAG: bifunctional glutamate N-acetyltransferase/amino-acid acetyltransferase ArgJ [Opitutales bacterium]
MTAVNPLSEVAGENPPPLCPGFRFSGVPCDVRGTQDGRLDLALVVSERPCNAAGVFTRNRVQAAPVTYCKEILDTSDSFHGLVANSGNANACTGPQGLADARALAEAAEGDDLPSGSMFVCSTGRIGRPLPMEKLTRGIAQARSSLAGDADAARNAATAILTSDTREKTAHATFVHDGQTVTVSGFAKGAGMIEPNMATMLAFILTDLEAPAELLQAALAQCVAGSFNALSIDGDMSTNDTVLLLGNGASTVKLKAAEGELWSAFTQALRQICGSLARKILADGERITKVVTLKIKGAPDTAGAEAVARAIANSLLVKTAWFGSDPNWGRVACAAGYAGVDFDPERLTIAYGAVKVLDLGAPVEVAMEAARAQCLAPVFEITVDLGNGDGVFELLTTDLSEGYVNFNKSE